MDLYRLTTHFRLDLYFISAEEYKKSGKKEYIRKKGR